MCCQKSTRQEGSFLLIDLKSNRRHKKPHGHAGKYFAIRWRIQMGLPKTIWENTSFFVQRLVQPEDHNDICTSAGGSTAKKKKRHGHCWKGSETTSPSSLYSLIHDTKFIVTTIKVNYVQRTLCKEGRRGTSTRIQGVRNLPSRASSKSADICTTQLVHDWTRLMEHRSCSWWMVLGRSQTTKVATVIRIYTSFIEVCSNKCKKKMLKRWLVWLFLVKHWNWVETEKLMVWVWFSDPTELLCRKEKCQSGHVC